MRFVDREGGVAVSSNEWLGWWFCRPGEDGVIRLPNGDGREVRAGETLRVDPPVVLCQRGLHASRRALDALVYAPGAVVSRVRLSGEIIEDEDKACATERTVLWMADATMLLHEFACWCAERALLRERNAGREPDPRSWRAIETKRAWLRGELGDRDLEAARVAAWDAAREAAWKAEREAVRVAARVAAWSEQAAELERRLLALGEARP